MAPQELLRSNCSVHDAGELRAAVLGGEVGAYGFIRFTFYESLTPEVLSRYSDPPEMCADDLSAASRGQAGRGRSQRETARGQVQVARAWTSGVRHWRLQGTKFTKATVAFPRIPRRVSSR